jgi:hypothetical protein
MTITTLTDAPRVAYNISYFDRNAQCAANEEDSMDSCTHLFVGQTDNTQLPLVSVKEKCFGHNHTTRVGRVQKK